MVALLMTEKTGTPPVKPASATSAGGNACAGEPGAPILSAAAIAPRKASVSGLVSESPWARAWVAWLGPPE
jgi:hypothetical protein